MKKWIKIWNMKKKILKMNLKSKFKIKINNNKKKYKKILMIIMSNKSKKFL